MAASCCAARRRVSFLPPVEPGSQRRAYAAEALTGSLSTNDADAVAGYSQRALARVWKAERFGWSLTRLMHRFSDDGPFECAMQVAELDYIALSRAAQMSISENYVGLQV
jgi:2-polyprenyl-6-methoxyphenol hydroxylase and related FAD-dependent oxidoreductases